MFIYCLLLYIVFTMTSVLLLPRVKKNKIVKFVFLIIFSTLFTLINVYCTSNSVQMGGDRYNYLLAFFGSKTTSVGLAYLFSLIRVFSNNINTVFYFTTFMTCFFMFWSFLKCKDTDGHTLLFLLLTNIIFFSFTGLKQIYTCILLFIVYCIYFNSTMRHKHFLNIILIVVSCLFHTTGYIMIPIYIILILYEKKEFKINKYLWIMVLFLIFFEPTLLFIAKSLGNVVPTLSNKILDYFGESSLHVDDGNSVLSFIKGFPFYIVSFVGLLKAKKLSLEVKDYDKYLFLSIIGSVLYFCSFFSYWFHRFTVLFYFPIGILFSILLKNINKGKDKLLFALLIYGSELIILIRWLYLIFANYGGF